MLPLRAAGATRAESKLEVETAFNYTGKETSVTILFATYLDDGRSPALPLPFRQE
ncbi:hypothetical protein YT1_1683 [Rhodococcus ruber]|nr:hypothetical protein YT1_1683 [Rhodococcus ruber]